MEEESKIVELLAEMLKRADNQEIILKGILKMTDRQEEQMGIMIEHIGSIDDRLAGIDDRLAGMDDRLAGIDKKIENLKGQQAKTNLVLGEMRLSYLKVADGLEKFGNHEERIQKLEKYIIRKAS